MVKYLSQRYLVSVCLGGLLIFALFPRQAFCAELESPAFTDYNTFLDQVNILELINVGTEELEATITVYSSTGFRRARQTIILQPLNQLDVLINDLVDQSNTYGFVKIEYDDSDTKLSGRMVVYREDADHDGEYSYVFAKELRNAVTGTTFVMSNTQDPQELGYLVSNWVQIMNPSSSAKTFTHKVYNRSGKLLSSTSVSVPALGRVDVSGGHERGEGLFLNRIIPSDSSAEYLANITRYGSNSTTGSSSRGYAFAFASDAKSGEGDDQFGFIANDEGDCFTQTNSVEIANVGTTTATATLTFYDEAKHFEDSDSHAYVKRSQFHFDGSEVLNSGEVGWVTIASDVSDAFLAQTVTYYLDCGDDSLQTGFVLPAQVATTSPLVGSYNRFLGMENQLYLIVHSSRDRTLDFVMRSSGAAIFSDDFQLDQFTVREFDLNDEAVFNTTEDTYGTVFLDANETASFIPFTLRTGRAGNDGDEVDFAVPTLFGQYVED